VVGIDAAFEPGARLTLRIRRASGSTSEIPVTARIDTAEELEYYRQGGILPQVYRELVRRL